MSGPTSTSCTSPISTSISPLSESATFLFPPALKVSSSSSSLLKPDRANVVQAERHYYLSRSAAAAGLAGLAGPSTDDTLPAYRSQDYFQV